MNTLLLTIIVLLIISAVVGHPALGTIFVLVALGIFIGITYKDMNSKVIEPVRAQITPDESVEQKEEQTKQESFVIEPCPGDDNTCKTSSTIPLGGPDFNKFYQYLTHDDEGRPDKYSVREDLPSGTVDPRYMKYGNKLDKALSLY